MGEPGKNVKLKIRNRTKERMLTLGSMPQHRKQSVGAMGPARCLGSLQYGGNRTSVQTRMSIWRTRARFK